MSDASEIASGPCPGVTPILTFDEVSWAVKLSKIEIYRRVKEDTFPLPFRLGRKQAWATAEVEAWLQIRMAVREEPRASRQQVDAAMRSAQVRKAKQCSQ
jgi:predicted DNA-binding transcriptional regulator AlpA